MGWPGLWAAAQCVGPEASVRSAVGSSLLLFRYATVALASYEWSGPSHQLVLLPWTEIRSEEILDDVLLTLTNATRREASPGTALGVAMRRGAEFLAERTDCAKLTLDISGDGKSNMGQRPAQAIADIRGRDLTIYGLVIGADAPDLGDLRQAEIAELSAYFRANVIMGEDAFVETALGFEEFAAAMARKLERELRVFIYSELDEVAAPDIPSDASPDQ